MENFSSTMFSRRRIHLFVLLILFIVICRIFYTTLWDIGPERITHKPVIKPEAQSPNSPSKLPSPFHDGTPKPPGSTYSQTLVVARLKSKDTSWIQEELPEINTAIYVVDDPSAPFHVPQNKGHEAMVYLTYIIDHYDNLPDTSIFIHSDRFTWHNNDLLDSDNARMIKRLSNERVAREGYFNLRCHLHPGCPDWLRLNTNNVDINKEEETIFKKVWSQLHPQDPMPDTLSQPCCGQFAVSRERIRGVPLHRYISWREWLLNTKLTDKISGRIFEYTWQYIFTGKPTFCPAMNICYCDGYGVCLGSAKKLDEWFEMRSDRESLTSELKSLKETKDGKLIPNPDTEKVKSLDIRIDNINKELERLKIEAWKRGDDPKSRALEVGRNWHDGDGF